MDYCFGLLGFPNVCKISGVTFCLRCEEGLYSEAFQLGFRLHLGLCLDWVSSELELLQQGAVLWAPILRMERCVCKKSRLGVHTRGPWYMNCRTWHRPRGCELNWQSGGLAAVYDHQQHVIRQCLVASFDSIRTLWSSACAFLSSASTALDQ